MFPSSATGGTDTAVTIPAMLEIVRYEWCIRNVASNKWVSGLKLWNSDNTFEIMGKTPDSAVDPCYYEPETILEGRIIGMSGTIDSGVETVGFVVDDSVCGTADDPFSSLPAPTQDIRPSGGFVSSNLLVDGEN